MSAWSEDDLKRLRELREQNDSYKVIGEKIGRSAKGVAHQIAKLRNPNHPLINSPGNRVVSSLRLTTRLEDTKRCDWCNDLLPSRYHLRICSVCRRNSIQQFLREVRGKK
jgi:hypothetical protein